MISIFVRRSAWLRRAVPLLPVMVVIAASGCGSSTTDVQGTAKEKTEEERFRYEGTGKAKEKVLIRRKDERLKALSEAAKKPG